LTGLTFDDTATAIALMGQAGIKGSDAGTSLKTFLSNLQPVTKKQIGLFKELGIVTADGANKFFDAKGNIKSMADVSGVLSDALKGMTNQQKTMALETLFGSDAIRAAAVMADKGTEGFNKMGDAMGKVSAAEVAEKRMDNFKGSLEQMKGSLETVGITLGTVLLPPLKQVVDAVADALNWFLNLDSGMQKFIVIALAVIGAVLLIVGAILKFIVMAAKVRVALLLLRGSMLATWAAALGPIALVIAAIAIIVGIIILLWKKNETFRNIVTGAWNAIKDAVSAVADWFTGTLLPALESVWKAITGGVTAVKDVIVNVWNGIVNFFQTVFAVISAIITTYINIWKTIITTALNIIKGIWTAIWGVFGGIIKAVFGLIVAIIRLALAVMFLIIQVWWNMIKQVTQAVWNAIKFVITSVWNSIKQAVRAGVQAVRAVVTAAWNVIRAVTRAVWNGIMAVIKAVWGKIGGTVTSAANKVKAVITAAWNAVKAVTKAVWTWLVQHVGARVLALVEKIKGIKDKVVGFFKGAGSWLFNAGKQIIQGLLNGIESLIHKVTDKLNWLTDHIPKIKGPPSKDEKLLVDNGELIMRSLITGFENMEPAVFSHLQGMTNSMGPSLAAATPSSVPLPTPTASGAPTALRMVGGELRLDKSGRAFIRGVAAEVVDENDYNTARGARRP
jgi:phage-related protein